MADAAWLNSQSKTFGQEARIWGRRGTDVRDQICDELGVTLDDEISSFICTVGNVSIAPFLVSIAGGNDGAMGAIERTKSLREVEPSLPPFLIQIMDQAGELYLYNDKNGTVAAYDMLNLDPTMKTLSFSSFDEFLTWVFKEASLQADDDMFKF
jgi:hypothetical protein